MCLQLFAVPANPQRVSAKRLSEVSGLNVVKRNQPVRNALHFSVDGGCSCSLMSDGADWNAPTWALDPAVLEGIGKALRLLADEAGGFRFQATWIGEDLESQDHVKLKEVVDDVANNRVRNKHAYFVGKIGPSG